MGVMRSALGTRSPGVKGRVESLEWDLAIAKGLLEIVDHVKVFDAVFVLLAQEPGLYQHEHHLAKVARGGYAPAPENFAREPPPLLKRQLAQAVAELSPADVPRRRVAVPFAVQTP